jgi:integrase
LYHVFSPFFTTKSGAKAGQKMSAYIKTKHKGIRYREHPTRKYGARSDRYYFIRFKLNGKDVEESLGWESEWKLKRDRDISLEEHAVSRLIELKRNRMEGSGPATLRELRAKNEAVREAEAAKLKKEAKDQRTLSEYWQESYFPAAKRSKKETSWEKEEQHFRLWIEPLFGKLPLRTIGLKQWDELVKTLSSAGMSPRSKEYITGTLRRILKHAYDRRMVDDPPPTGKRVGISGPGNNRRLRVISHEEEVAIMEYLSISDPHAWKITRFCFLTGCRASEAFSLTWNGVDFSRGVITFPETKNHDSRTIPITTALMELFDAMGQGLASVHVFLNSNGAPYKEAPSAFATAVENLELNEGRTKRDRIVFHSIRHTVGARLAQRLGPRDLMDVMGWRTVQMAMRYVHANQDAKMKALSMLGAAPAEGNVLPFHKAGMQ